jgi:hypothetical protein
VALELRPNCEYCDRDLPPESTLARICTYECTFCAECVDQRLHNVCPNCGGGFAPRPIRPAVEWRPGLSLAKGQDQRRGCICPIPWTTSRCIRRASRIFRLNNVEPRAGGTFHAA